MVDATAQEAGNASENRCAITCTMQSPPVITIHLQLTTLVISACAVAAHCLSNAAVPIST